MNSNKEFDDEDENNFNLFQMIFIRINEILSNELINDFIEIIFNETKVLNDTCCDYENNNREIQKVLSTDWISKYQVSKILFSSILIYPLNFSKLSGI